MKIVVILLAAISINTQLCAQIPTATLTHHLEVLSTEWNSSDVSAANSIFEDYKNEPIADWISFFDNFFATHHLTDDLNNYIGYPTFFWLSDQVHINLQTALLPALQKKQNEMLLEASISDSLSNNIPWRSTLINCNRLMADYLRHDLVHTTRHHQNIANYYLALVTSHPILFHKSVILDQSQYPHMGQVLTQVYATLASYNYRHKDKTMDIYNTIGLNTVASEYEQNLFLEFGVIVAHNGVFDTRMLALIYDIFDATPKSLHRVVIISTQVVLSGSPHGTRSIAGFNTTSTGNGLFTENGFPSEVSPYPVDVFSLVVAHELSHNTDHHTLNEQGHFLRAHRDKLLAAAGDSPINYLRSVVSAGFFTDYPQEFMASISNMYYADTELTFEVGRIRFDNGVTQPINQFLLFANLMSADSDSTVFIQMSDKGSLVHEHRKVEKDNDGYITKIYLDEYCFYEFTLDANKFVTQITPPNCGCVTEYAASTDTQLKGNKYESYSYEASGKIESTQKIQTLNGTNITYDAGDCIELKAGFEIIEGASLEAVIDGCGN